MHRSTHIATIVTLLLAAFPAAGEELYLGWSAIMEYESRVFRGDDDVNWQFGPRVQLTGDHRRLSYSLFHESRYELHADLGFLDAWRHQTRGEATYVINPRTTFTVTDSYSVVPRIRAVQDIEAGTIDIEDPILQFEESEVQSNVFSATLSYAPTARLGTTTTVSHFWRDIDDPGRRQGTFDFNTSSNSTTFGSQANYVLTSAHSVGIGGRLRSREFTVARTQQEATTLTYNAFASWNWTIDERTTFSLQAGPSFSEDDPSDPVPAAFGLVPRSPEFLADPNSCATSSFASLSPAERQLLQDLFGLSSLAVLDGSCQAIAGQRALNVAEQEFVSQSAAVPSNLQFGSSEDDSNVDFFVSANFRRSWERLTFQAGWVRSDSQTQGFGSATIQDTVRTTLSWNFRHRWQAVFNFVFTRRTSDIQREILLPIFGGASQTLDIPGGDGPLTAFPVRGLLPVDEKLLITNDLYTVQLRLAREVGRDATIFAEAQYRDQETRNETDFDTITTSRDLYRLWMGFTYRFRPIRL